MASIGDRPIEAWTDKWVMVLQITMFDLFGFDKDSDLEMFGDQMFIATRKGNLVEFKGEEVMFEDFWFRWTPNTFKYSTDLVMQFGKSYIRMFSASKVRDRILANKEHIKMNDDKTQFACRVEIVADLIRERRVEEFHGYDETWSKTKGSNNDECIDDSCKININ